MKNIDSMFKRIYGKDLFNDVSNYILQHLDCKPNDIKLSLALSVFLDEDKDSYDTVIFTTKAFGIYSSSFFKEGKYVFTGTDWRYVCEDLNDLIEYYELLLSRNEVRRCGGIELLSAEKALIKSPEFLHVYGRELTELLCHQFDDYSNINDSSLVDMLHNWIRNGNINGYKTRYIFANDLRNPEEHTYGIYVHGIPERVICKQGVYIQLPNSDWRYVVENFGELRVYTKKFDSDDETM